MNGSIDSERRCEGGEPHIPMLYINDLLRRLLQHSSSQMQRPRAAGQGLQGNAGMDRLCAVCCCIEAIFRHSFEARGDHASGSKVWQ